MQRDIRTPPLASERKLVGHRQEVCGLKWSPDNQYLASGGNDNKLFVWNASSLQPVHAFTEHLAGKKEIYRVRVSVIFYSEVRIGIFGEFFTKFLLFFEKFRNSNGFLAILTGFKWFLTVFFTVFRLPLQKIMR